MKRFAILMICSFALIAAIASPVYEKQDTKTVLVQGTDIEQSAAITTIDPINQGFLKVFAFKIHTDVLAPAKFNKSKQRAMLNKHKLPPLITKVKHTDKGYTDSAYFNKTGQQ